MLFARSPARVDAILINTSGGLTSDDSLTLNIDVQAGGTAALTTQAAERAYRAPQGPAHVKSTLTVGDNATAFWLPQELILFDGAHLDRRLTCALAGGARFLMVEPVIFGRAQMGEHLKTLAFKDRIEISRKGAPLYLDALHLTADLLEQSAIASNAGAMASLIYVGPEAAGHAEALQSRLPAQAGLSLLQDDVLALRLLAADGFALRQTLLPLLDHLTGHTLPTSWRL